VPGGISAQKSYSTVVNSGLTPAKIAALGAAQPERRPPLMMRDSKAARQGFSLTAIIQHRQMLGLCSWVRYL
jgi:hypothetical protein